MLPYHISYVSQSAEALAVRERFLRRLGRRSRTWAVLTTGRRPESDSRRSGAGTTVTKPLIQERQNSEGRGGCEPSRVVFPISRCGPEVAEPIGSVGGTGYVRERSRCRRPSLSWPSAMAMMERQTPARVGLSPRPRMKCCSTPKRWSRRLRWKGRPATVENTQTVQHFASTSANTKSPNTTARSHLAAPNLSRQCHQRP